MCTIFNFQDFHETVFCFAPGRGRWPGGRIWAKQKNRKIKKQNSGPRILFLCLSVFLFCPQARAGGPERRPLPSKSTVFSDFSCTSELLYRRATLVCNLSLPRYIGLAERHLSGLAAQHGQNKNKTKQKQNKTKQKQT